MGDARAYIRFRSLEDVFAFKRDFESRGFPVDNSENSSLSYAYSIEFAPYQHIRRDVGRKNSALGTIESDPDYVKFFERLQKEEAREEESEGAQTEVPKPSDPPGRRNNDGDDKVRVTALMDYLAERHRKRKKIQQKKDATKKSQTSASSAGKQKVGDKKKQEVEQRNIGKIKGKNMSQKKGEKKKGGEVGGKAAHNKGTTVQRQSHKMNDTNARTNDNTPSEHARDKNDSTRRKKKKNIDGEKTKNVVARTSAPSIQPPGILKRKPTEAQHQASSCASMPSNNIKDRGPDVSRKVSIPSQTNVKERNKSKSIRAAGEQPLDQGHQSQQFISQKKGDADNPQGEKARKRNRRPRRSGNMGTKTGKKNAGTPSATGSKD